MQGAFQKATPWQELHSIRLMLDCFYSFGGHRTENDATTKLMVAPPLQITLIALSLVPFNCMAFTMQSSVNDST